MISIEEALSAVLKNTEQIASGVNQPVETSGNAILFQDVFSPINKPPFRQSAMDGYAVHLHQDLVYSTIGEVKAGDGHQFKLQPGEAVRIFTGAPVPDSANAIVIQEEVKVRGNQIDVQDSAKKGQNIRPLGEQVKAGEIALKKGTRLTPAGIGYLSSLGIKEIMVYKKPSIAIVTTGNELTDPGIPLAFGKIYESNSVMLKSALLGLGFDSISIHKVKDNYEETCDNLKQVMSENDLIIISGGISVGDYDYVGRALKELEVEQIFYKVHQKPGKPLFFGKKGETVLFALPGNPAAALTCFYMYVYPSVQKMAGLNPDLKKTTGISTSNFTKKGDRPQFLKAIYTEGKISILEGQSSAMLQTFAMANALVKVPGELEEIKINDTVEVFLLPV